MSRRRRQVVLVSESEGEGAGIGEPPVRPRGRLRKAGGPADGSAERTGARVEGAAAAAAAAPAGALPLLETPARRAPRQPPPRASPREALREGGLQRQRSLRDRGAVNARKQRWASALERLRSGWGGVDDIAADSSSGGEEDEEGGGEPRPAWGRLAWPRPPLQRPAAGGGGGLEDELEDEVDESAEEEEEEEEEEADWDANLGDFVVEDEGNAAAAFAELRGVTGGSAMSDEERHQLLCQLRLLRALGALPAAADLSPEERACVAAALEIERDLQQQREQANNLEGWRRADAGMREKFEECPVVKRGGNTYQMGRHCAFCRHDRRKHFVMNPLKFLGQRSPVVWLEPELRQRGLLPGGAAPQHGMPHAPPGSSDEEEGGSSSGDEEEGGGSATSSSDEETLLARYNRRHAEQQGQQQQRGKRQRQQRQAAPRKRRRGAVQAAPSSSDDEAEGSEEEGEEESSGSGSDPAQSDSEASDGGANPRRHPRIGVDCWARAFMYHAIHRYPARLDAMLLALTRRYLAATPEQEQPSSWAGLAVAVVRRYGHLLRQHWATFQRAVSDFNVLQNRRKDKTTQNGIIARDLQGKLYAPTVQLEPQELLQGVDIGAELARFDAVAAARRRRGRGRGACGNDGGGLLLRIEGAAPGEAAVEGDRNVSADEEEEEEEEEEAAGFSGPAGAGHSSGGSGSEDELGGGSGRRPPGRRGAVAAGRSSQPAVPTPAARRPLREPSWQQRHNFKPQGGQRAAAAIAAASEAFAQQQRQQQHGKRQQQHQQPEEVEVIVIDDDDEEDRREAPPPPPPPQQQQQQQQQQPAAPAGDTCCACCGGQHATSDCPVVAWMPF